jgi:hypothetical protein
VGCRFHADYNDTGHWLAHIECTKQEDNSTVSSQQVRFLALPSDHLQVTVSKLLKKSPGTLCRRGSVSVVQPSYLFCPGAPKPWLLLSYQWTMLVVKTSMFHLQCIFLSETCCSKNAEAAENGHIVHFLSLFQRSVTHSTLALEAHQAVTIKARVCCVHVRSFSVLICIILAVASVFKIF